MKKFLIILIVIAAAIYMAVGMNLRDTDAQPALDTSKNELVESSGNKPVGNDSQAKYKDLDHVKGHPSTNIIKEYTGFRLSFNPGNRTPDWVAWELLGSETDGTAGRSNNFWQDPDLEGCPETRDYSRSGYDRGHLCPAADQKWSAEAMRDCFVMANMCPQDHALNSGAWKTLEEKERAWARRDSAIVIVAGPIYSDADTKRIGQAGVRVPGAFYKVLIAPYADKPRGIGFIYPNMTSPGSMEQYVTTIDDVEKLTGLDFFHELPDDIENIVESTASFKSWNRK